MYKITITRFEDDYEYYDDEHHCSVIVPDGTKLAKAVELAQKIKNDAAAQDKVIWIDLYRSRTSKGLGHHWVRVRFGDTITS